MYLDFLVSVPDAKGKITHKPKGDAIYVNYEYGREYDKEKKYNVPKRVIIGKLSKTDHSMMQPNQNFLTYFPEIELPDDRFNSDRSSCLRIGGYIVVDRIFEEYGIPSF